MNIGPNELDHFRDNLVGTMYVITREDPDHIKEPQILGVCKKGMSIEKIKMKLRLSNADHIVIKGPVPFLYEPGFSYKPDPLKPDFHPDPFKPDFPNPNFDPKFFEKKPDFKIDFNN